MGLESPDFINDLDPANPIFEDFIAEGDDHLRNFKKAVKQTFPGMAGRAWRKRTVSASAPVTLTDNMSLIYATQTLTLTPAAANVLGNGWMIMVRAAGGNVTVNPGENINGAGQITVPNGYTAIVISDGTEFFAMMMYQDVPPSVKAFPTGTKMLFNQTSAPTGWTKNTSSANNDAAIRLTTGTVGVGGSEGFSSTFSAGKSTNGFSLTEAHNGPHAHPANHSHAVNSKGNDSTDSGGSVVGGGSTGSSGSGSPHAHSIPAMNLKYVDCIVASID